MKKRYLILMVLIVLILFVACTKQTPSSNSQTTNKDTTKTLLDNNEMSKEEAYQLASISPNCKDFVFTIDDGFYVEGTKSSGWSFLGKVKSSNPETACSATCDVDPKTKEVIGFPTCEGYTLSNYM